MDTNSRRLLDRIKNGTYELPPTFVGMRFIRDCPGEKGDAPAGSEEDLEFTWAVYISHDPCHDGGGHQDDRNTVIAFHRWNGTFRILGRELNGELARKIACGEV